MKIFSRNEEIIKFGFFIALILIFDQFSKYVVYDYFSFHEEVIAILPFLNFIIVWNYGVSFGMLNDIDQGQVILSTLAIFVIITLIFLYKKSKNKKLILPLSLIIGGAVGNIIDRVNYGAVLDFIDFHAFGWHYPTFNVADIAVFVGASIFLFTKKI